MDKVKQMQQQMADLVDLTGELQKELIHNLSLRRDGLLLQQSAIQEDKNLGVLLRPNEGLQVTVAATKHLSSASRLLPPAARKAYLDSTRASALASDTWVWWQALTENKDLQTFLERWVAGKIDPGGESAAARASEDKMYRFGYEWRDCLNLIQLFHTCAPGSLKPFRAEKDLQEAEVVKSKQAGEGPEDMRLLSVAERANAVASHVEVLVGGEVVSSIEIQNGSQNAVTLIAASLFLSYPQVLGCGRLAPTRSLPPLPVSTRICPFLRQ